MVQIRHGVLCIKGNFRKNNEDAVHIDSAQRLFLVADGMGGQNAGERASGLAVELIPEHLTRHFDFSATDSDPVAAAMDEAIRHANNEILSLGEIDEACRSMGTTVVFGVVSGGSIYFGGIGDSRAYLLRDRKIEQLTKDHTVTAALVESGTITPEEAKTHRYQNMLHRYLGSKEANKGAELRRIDPQPGDRFVICSDGVTGGVEDDQLAQLLADGDDPQAIAETMVRSAEEGGSKDNITCVVMIIDG